MKIVATRDMRFGMTQLAEGEEIDLPDDFAKRLIHAGHATEAGDKPAKKARAAKDETKEEPPKKEYKTRQIKAEDSD